jgi:hypothetical protein
MHVRNLPILGSIAHCSVIRSRDKWRYSEWLRSGRPGFDSRLEQKISLFSRASVVPVNKKGHKTDGSNNGGISLLSASYKIVYILSLKVNSVARRNYWFRRNRSVTGEKCEYDETVHKVYVDFKKAYDSGRREVLYSILIDFGLPMKLVRLI